MRAALPIVACFAFLTGCAPKLAPYASAGPLARPPAVQKAYDAIRDPLGDATRIRVAVQLVRAGEQKAKAEWSGWLPLDGKSEVPGSAAGEDELGELQMVVEMIRPRALVDDVLGARPYRWAREGDLYRGTMDASGSYVSVRLDDRDRIAFIRSNAPGRPRGLDLRYEGKTSWVSEMDVHDDGLDLGMRWTARAGGLLDLDVGAATDDAAGEIHVRVLEIERAEPR